jgi:hypothetical protein
VLRSGPANHSRPDSVTVEKGLQRKLRAIFSADVKGYSKLMGDDDEYTVNTLTKYRQIIAALIEIMKAGSSIHLVTTFWLNSVAL